MKFTFRGRSLLLSAFSFLLLSFFDAQGQSGLCDPNTPFYTVNLTGNPGGTWVSAPPIQRAGNCCGTSPPDRCIEFSITLDPTAVAINFEIASGAVPPGALFYQVGCGPPVAVGTPICLNGPGPYTLTFCKPGNNQNTYAITSIPGPRVSPDVATSDGCSVTMGSVGLNLSSITWNSIYPGTPGQYNSYLSCQSGCDTTVVTPQPGYPLYVDYVICGYPSSGACASTAMFCDTIRASFLPPIANTINPNPATFCISDPGVMLNGVINGGAPPYTFNWTNSSNISVGTSQNYFATAPGTYTLEVRDTTYPRCPAKFTSVVVTTHPIPTVQAGPDVTVCPGNSNVMLNASFTNATGVTWSGGSGSYNPGVNSPNPIYTPSPAEVAAGFVILTVSSTGNGPCPPATDQIQINITPPLSLQISPPHVICYGTQATLSTVVSGGTQPYQYSWSTGATTSSITGVPAGTYTVTVTDATSNACVKTSSVTITENPQITVNVPANTIVSCDSTVLVNVTATGGNGVFNYVWNTGSTSPSIAVNSGMYIITAYDSFGCSARDTVIIQAANTSIAVSVNQPSIICNGATTTLTASPSGGFGDYNYSWSNGLNSQSVTVPAGSFCVTLADSVGCLTTACATITQSPPLQISIATPPLICFGSTTTLNPTVTGGTAPYSYSWSNGQTTQNITVLAGTYTLTVRDANSNICTATATVTVNQESDVTGTVSTTNVTCNGAVNGTATVTASGGTAPYSYAWSPYGGNGTTAYGLVAGNYTVTVIDNIGCTEIIPVTISEPPLLTMTLVSTTPVSCYGGNNGTASVSVTGGTAPYSFSWSGAIGSLPNASGLSAGPHTVTVVDFKGCVRTLSFVIGQPPALTITVTAATNVSCYAGTNGTATVSANGGTGSLTYYWWETGGTSATETGLAMGNYTVTVRDSLNCVSTTTVSISQPPLLQTSITSSSDILCNGDGNGTATVTATGGFGTYTYSWSPVSANTATINNVSGGTYNVTVTDANGCTSTASTTIYEPPQLLFVTAGAFPTNCYGVCDGIAVVIPSGGTSPYSYSWYPGTETDPSITGLCPGSYLSTVVDGNGCIADTLLTVTEPAPNQIFTGSTSANCNQPNGSASASASGASPFNYTWSTSPIQYTQTASNLFPGTYTITVTDNRNCSQTDTVIVGNLPGVSATAGAVTGTVCKGDCNGQASVIPNGGSSPYTYSWSTLNPQTSSSTSQLCGGQQSVVVTDADGCKDTVFVTVPEPDPVIISISGQNNTICIGQSASLTVSASGGSSPYSYSWNTGSTTPSIFVSPTVTTTYTVTARDSKNCSSGDSTFIVNVHPGLSTLASNDTMICRGEEVTLIASASGGNNNHTYTWTPGPTYGPTLNVSPTSTTVYTVRINDNCGSPSVTENVTVTVNPLPVVSFSVSDSAGCAPLCVTFEDQSTSANGTISAWNWDFGNGTSTAQNPTHCFDEPSSYSVTLSAVSNYGCVRTQTFTNTVTIYPDPVAEYTMNPQEVLITGPAIQFTDQSINANTWEWNFNDPLDTTTSTLQHPSFMYSDTGTFCPLLRVRSINGCEATVEHCVTVGPFSTFFIPNSFSPNGDGVNDYFFPKGMFIKDFHMDIFDRWGNLIFTSRDMTEAWDGKANGGSIEAQEDVYVYQLYYVDLNGKKEILRGAITLVK